jgi:hypothetical protein
LAASGPLRNQLSFHERIQLGVIQYTPATPVEHGAHLDRRHVVNVAFDKRMRLAEAELPALTANA